MERLSKIRRRDMLLRSGAVMVGGLAAASLGGCTVSTSRGGGGQAASGSQLFVRSVGGGRENTFKQYLWPTFTKETGVEIVPVTANLAKMLAMVQAGQADLDVVDTGALGIDTMRRAGALVKLDKGRFTRFNSADIEVSDDYWLSIELYSEVLAYNSKQIQGTPPGSWADFWDVARFPGRRVLEDAAGEKPPLEQALLADGVPVEKLYPLDVDRAFRVLGAVKPNILKFWTSGTESESLFSTGQADMGQAWSGRVAGLASAGQPLTIVWNGAGNAAQAVGILKGTPREDLAYKYIDFILSPESQATFVSNFPDGPGNRKALGLIKDQGIIRNFGNNEQYKGKVFYIDARWWGDNMESVLKRWTEFTAA